MPKILSINSANLWRALRAQHGRRTIKPRKDLRGWRAAAYISSYIVSRLVPRRVGEWIADMASGMAHAIKSGERADVRKNLSVILNLPVDSFEVQRAAKNVYQKFGRACVDLLYEIQSPSLPIPSRIHFENLKLLDDAVAEGRGVILLGAHSGCWELGALALASRGYPITVPVQAPAGRWVSRLYYRERSRIGLRTLDPGESPIKCIRALKSGGILGVLGDRKFFSKGVQAQFFGRMTVLPQGPARLSLLCGSPILSASMRRSDAGTYVMRFYARMDPATGSANERTIGELQNFVTDQLEKLIADAPEEWFCFEGLWNHDN